MVGGKRVPRTVNEIKANLAKKKDYLKDPMNHHILSIEYLRNAAKKQGVRVTKNVGGKRVSKNENELLKNLGNMRT
jgi:tryptophanase